MDGWMDEGGGSRRDSFGVMILYSTSIICD